ncbi:MAG: CHASE2 domain-containing serine/threonine-protein kinase [Porticoccaceae bacterium]
MNKAVFWKKDWFIALVISMVFLVVSRSAPIVSLERVAYDWGLQSTSREADDRIAVIAIDDESLANLGRWPWPRDLHAELIDILADAGAKVIGYTAFFFEPQRDPGLDVIYNTTAFLEQAGLVGISADEQGNLFSIPGPVIETLSANTTELYFAAAQLGGADPETLNEDNVDPEVWGRARQSLDVQQTGIADIQDALVSLNDELNFAIETLDVDQVLANSIAEAGNVLLPMIFRIGNPLGNPDTEIAPYAAEYALDNIDDRIGSGYYPLPAIDVDVPIDEIGGWAAGLGHLNAYPDVDGGIRSEPLVLDYYGDFYPSLSLKIAAQSLNLDDSDIRVLLGEGVQVGRLDITTNETLQMNTFFYGDEEGRPAFQVDSFYDVYVGDIPASKYRDKIVLIGATAAGLGSNQVTPINPAMSPVVTLAHSVSSILNEDFFIVPDWAPVAESGAYLLVALFLMLMLPRLNATGGALVTAGLLAIFLVMHYVFMTQQAMWLQLMLPSALLVVGYVLITTKRFLVTERGKERADMESGESNRMLGLAFQGQGQLDMAFEKFRKCPKDETLAESMFNLALDYERKRQFGKASSVYQYIHDFAPKFKDVAERIDRSKKMEDTVVLGGSGGHAGGSMSLDVGEKPMLGRYQVQKELGKGAMGIVYLGQDPKISRTVAIKTMALSQEFEEDELDDVKERFFREAETAGRLNHPNIVTIYDAGDEHDLAYIAMEFIKGKDLVAYTKKDNLLPLPKVFELIAKSAAALDYAHKQNVVHRDIKPANIMWDAESNELKITDFGIARITDSSKTKTGVVLGTPSYMSPEQLSGKKIDGRSDLFSLGVMLYQMLTGSLPFHADSMATLMYKIANENPSRVSEINPRLPPEIDDLIEKALAKDADARFQSGGQMAKALKECVAKIKARQSGS